jgi:hypothetical protein
MKTVWLSTLTIALVAASACNSSRPPGGGDGGPIIIPDSAVPRDGARDGGTSTGMCTDENVGYLTMPLCSAATMTCIMGCTAGACIVDCIEADPSPNCGACVNQNLISCANTNGCQSAWSAFVCCVDEACPPPAMAACVMSATTGACMAQDGAYSTCLMGIDIPTVCPSFLTDCF